MQPPPQPLPPGPLRPLSAPNGGEPPLYEAFYGFREPPFALSTDPRFFFLSEAHHQAYEALLTGLRRHEGILLLTGESGTGKTILCRAVLDALGPRTFSALIATPSLSDAEMVRVVLREFGLVSRDEIRRGALARADMPQLLDALETFLRSLVPLDAHAVLILEEAQSLPPAVLDRIRVLGSFEQDHRPLLQIVLVGQPALAETIRAEPLRALNERITRRTELTPLTAAEVDRYIEHRLDVAGGAKAVTFEREALALIARLSGGLPRRVNVICDRALEEGHVACSSIIDGEMIRRAARGVAGTLELNGGGDAAVVAMPPAAELAPTRIERQITFGQTPAPASTGRKTFLFALALMLVGAGVAGYFVWALPRLDVTLPPAPTAPTLDVGRGPSVLTPEETNALFVQGSQDPKVPGSEDVQGFQGPRVPQSDAPKSN